MKKITCLMVHVHVNKEQDIDPVIRCSLFWLTFCIKNTEHVHVWNKKLFRGLGGGGPKDILKVFKGDPRHIFTNFTI